MNQLRNSQNKKSLNIKDLDEMKRCNGGRSEENGGEQMGE